MRSLLLTANAPLHRRLGGYLAERFPPVVYTILVALFVGSAQLLARAQDPEGAVHPRAWLGAVVVWLAFLHLRLMDEQKDFAQDKETHPDRLLSRGVVTLPLLKRMLWGVLVVEAGVVWMLGTEAQIGWAVMVCFTVAMRLEFGVGAWLSKHIVLYAITHNPVVGLLAIFAHASTGLRLRADYLPYVLLVSVASLAFEVARKTREPEEEIPGVESYSSALGRRGAAALLTGLSMLTVLLGLWTLWPLMAGVAGVIAVSLLCLSGLVAVCLALPGQPAKRVELGGSLLLLLAFVAVGVAAW